MTRFSYGRNGNKRCVCVESRRDADPVALYFFRHGDGSWCVFPPMSDRQAFRSHMNLQ
ncbi:hypothetical protein C7S13_4746 [Burkholderia cepacia]|nr:hypothetical protein [Burkholderia cepacia]